MMSDQPGYNKLQKAVEPQRSLLGTAPRQYLIWIGAVLLILGPMVPIIYAAFRDRPLYDANGLLTIANFQKLFVDPDFWKASLNTVQFAVILSALSITIGISIAVFVERTNLPGRKVLSGLLVVPILLPGLALSMGWVTMYAPYGFISNFARQTLGFVPWNLNSIPGMALVGSGIAIPIVYLFTRGSLERMDASLENSARSVGASPIRTLLSVTIPMLRPVALSSGLIVATLAIESLGIPLLFGTSENIETLSSYLYNEWVTEVPADQGLVSAGAIVMLLIVTLLLVLRNRVVGMEERYTTTTGKPGSHRPLELGWIRWPISIIIAGYIGLTLIAPVGGLILSAFTKLLTPLVPPWEMLTFQHVTHVWNEPVFRRAIYNSIFIAAVGGALATLAIAVMSIVAHRSEFRFRKSLQYLMMYPRALPGMIVGIGFFWAFVILDPIIALRSSIWAIIIAFGVRNLAMGYGAIYPTLAGLGKHLDQAARTVGADWWTASRKITIQLLKPAIFSTYILMFVRMLSDYDPAVFLVTPGTEVIGLTMLQLWLFGITGPVATLGLIQMIITIVAILIGRRLFGMKNYA